MGRMFGWGRAYTDGYFSHFIGRTFLHINFCIGVLCCVSLSAHATLKTADATSENFAPKLNLHWACSPDVTVLSNGNTTGQDGYCPFGNQTSYAVTFSFKGLSTDDYMDHIRIWPNSGGVYNDLELRTLDLQVSYIDEATGLPAELTMKNVKLRDTQSADDPQSVYFKTDKLGLIDLQQVSSITLSNLRNNEGSTGETPLREVQFNVFSPPPGELSATKTITMKNKGAYALPGSEIIYTLDVYNKGGTYISENSIFLVDTLPEDFEFYNGDFDGTGQATLAVLYNQSNAGLSFDYQSDYAFSNAKSKPSAHKECDYKPLKGYDSNIRYVCLRPQGSMIGERKSGKPVPHFQIQFGGRIK